MVSFADTSDTDQRYGEIAKQNVTRTSSVLGGDVFVSLERKHIEKATQYFTKDEFHIQRNCTTKPDRSNSKLTVVFIASSHLSSFMSLNDALLTNAKLQANIVFLFSFIATVDIKHMHRQILIAPVHFKNVMEIFI